MIDRDSIPIVWTLLAQDEPLPAVDHAKHIFVPVPLITTAAMHPVTWPPGEFDLVAMTSPRTVDFIPKDFIPRLGQRPIATFSAKTSAALKAIGLTATNYPEATSSEALAQALLSQQNRSGHILLLGAETMATSWREIFRGTGLAVTELALYRTTGRKDFASKEWTALMHPRAVITLFSPSAARALRDAFARKKIPHEPCVVVVGETTRDEALAFWTAGNIHVAETPNAAAVRRLAIEIADQR